MTLANALRPSALLAMAVGLLAAPTVQACTPEAYMSPGAAAKISGGPTRLRMLPRAAAAANAAAHQ